VSYFDEGVFGGGIGSQGLVCFDSTGVPTFRYGDFAEQNGLPMICDCYAMNATPSGDVWLNYYTDFPLVRLHDCSIQNVWRDFGVMGNNFAIRDGAALHVRDTKFMTKDLEHHQPMDINAIDEGGFNLTPISSPHLGVAARAASLVINTGTAIYESIA
jgi:hypothetical protein